MLPATLRQIPLTRCLVKVLCGCIGEFRPEHSRLDGEYPYLQIKVAVACKPGHPDHVAPGTIIRVPPYVGTHTDQVVTISRIRESASEPAMEQVAPPPLEPAR